jgi:hypothetical protein
MGVNPTIPKDVTQKITSSHVKKLPATLNTPPDASRQTNCPFLTSKLGFSNAKVNSNATRANCPHFSGKI